MKMDPFYLIVDAACWIERFVPLGVKLVQLRLKNRSEEAIYSQIKRARQICDYYGCQLVVNDYWAAAINLGCDVVHLGQQDLDSADLAAIRRAGLRLGISTHDEAELTRALALDPDYVALGPIYPTTLKKMKWAPQGTQKLARWKAQTGSLPLVGIGGITLASAARVLSAGADCAAVVSDILSSEQPEQRVEQWIEITQPWR